MNHRVEFLQRFHWLLLLMYIKRRLRGGSRWDGIGKKEKKERIDDKNWSFDANPINGARVTCGMPFRHIRCTNHSGRYRKGEKES